MRLIAKKPCSFGGQKFYIGDEIQLCLVADVKLQEQYGVVTIIDDGIGVPGGQPGTLFTREQVDTMIAEAVEEAGKKRADQMAVLQGYTAELRETEFGAYDGTVQIAVKGAADGQLMAIPARPEEIQQVFAIMQLNAEDGIRAIADVESENVLILLHAAESRKTVRNAAKEQADKLPQAGWAANGPSGGNGTTGTTEGADT